MATKQTKSDKKVTKKVTVKEDKKVKPNVANVVPAESTQADIDPVVAKEPKLSFDERTQGVQNQPWLNEDGTQNNGVEEESK